MAPAARRDGRPVKLGAGLRSGGSQGCGAGRIGRGRSWLGKGLGTIVFDPADQLIGEEADRAAAAHGDEVPVANDSYKVNDDPTVHTLALSPDVEIGLINWDQCCATVTADPESFKASFRGSDNYWGFWVTLEDGVVVKIEEQYHP
jgi:hypothetical protein